MVMATAFTSYALIFIPPRILTNLTLLRILIRNFIKHLKINLSRKCPLKIFKEGKILCKYTLYMKKTTFD